VLLSQNNHGRWTRLKKKHLQIKKKRKEKKKQRSVVVVSYFVFCFFMFAHNCFYFWLKAL